MTFATESNIALSPTNASLPKLGARWHNKIDEDICDRLGMNCPLQGFGYYCCKLSEFGGPQCCSTSNIQPAFHKPSGDGHWLHRFSLWNMWYFWFIIVLIMATCFTGCNYWRRQRRSYNFRLFQRQYAAITGHGARRSAPSGGPQMVVPITMYEISPHTILRLMRENASYRTALSSGRGSARSASGHREHMRDRTVAPPSYGEVTSNPNTYPPKPEQELEPPSYESVSRSTHRDSTMVEDGDVQASPSPSLAYRSGQL